MKTNTKTNKTANKTRKKKTNLSKIPNEFGKTIRLYNLETLSQESICTYIESLPKVNTTNLRSKVLGENTLLESIKGKTSFIYISGCFSSDNKKLAELLSTHIHAILINLDEIGTKQYFKKEKPKRHRYTSKPKNLVEQAYCNISSELENIVKQAKKDNKSIVIYNSDYKLKNYAIILNTLGKAYYKNVVSLFCCDENEDIFRLRLYENIQNNYIPNEVALINAYQNKYVLCNHIASSNMLGICANSSFVVNLNIINRLQKTIEKEL